MTTEERREQRLQLLDDEIGRKLRESQASGELRAAPSYGKPLDFGDGYDQTPAELRMGMKVLKDAGVLPPELQLMRDIAALRASLQGAPDDEATRAAGLRLQALQQQLSMQLERLGRSGSL